MLTNFNDINVKKLTSLKLIVRTNSLNLNPVDYCVWNVLQERVYYCTKVDNVVDLKQHILAE